MIATKFLTTKDFKLYRTWLNERSMDSLALYFGVATSESFINSVVDKIVANPDNHYFLVATIGTKWVGVIHMAQISATQMEFGVMVDEQHRGEGIADALMREAITWIQNRNFDRLYLHCLNRNTAMKHLATKHGLVLHEEYGDIEAITHVPPPSILSYTQEALTVNKNIFFLNLQNTFAPLATFAG
jgi:RimJ/RimL family protein N-acetyltransferase